jgi:hypothetical protein
MKQIRTILTLAALALPMPTFAHEATGPNGGRVVDAGNYHVELVVNGTQVDVFVSDGNDKPVAPGRFKATAIFNAGGKVQRVALTGDKAKLTGKAEASLPGNVRGVVQLTLPDGKTAQGQFK